MKLTHFHGSVGIKGTWFTNINASLKTRIPTSKQVQKPETNKGRIPFIVITLTHSKHSNSHA